LFPVERKKKKKSKNLCIFISKINTRKERKGSPAIDSGGKQRKEATPAEAKKEKKKTTVHCGGKEGKANFTVLEGG